MEYRNVLLCNEDYIKTFTNISDNISGDYILPAIYFAQRQNLEECLGTALIRKLQELVGNEEIENFENEHYKILLDDYIQDYLAFQAVSEIVVNTSFKINNLGANRTDDEKAYGLSFSEVYKLRDYYKSKADYLMYRMQRFLIANYADYPELVEYKTIADLQTNLYSAADVPILLGGARNPKQAHKPSLKELYNFPSSDNKKKGGK
jgi:hypothetical protein